MEFPLSSLIICTRNRPQLLRDTVTSVLDAEVLPSELIIVDQSDVGHAFFDGLPNSKGCQIRHLCTDHIGSSFARNHGMHLASHDIVAFLDDDMLVAPDWYSALIQVLIELGPRTAVTGRVLAAAAEEPAAGRKPKKFVLAVHAWEEPCLYQGRIGKDILASGLMAIYRTAFEAVGGFDERLGPGTFFRAAEDNDLGFRLLEAGYRIAFTPDSVVYHRAWRPLRDYVPMHWSYGLGQGAFYAKHWHPKDRYTLSRAAKDCLRYINLIPQRVWKLERLILLGGAAFVLGEWVGATAWFLRRESKKP